MFRAMLVVLVSALSLACQDGTALPRVAAGPETASPVFPWASPASVDLDEPVLSSLGDSLEAWVAAGDVAGGELLIIRDGRTVLHEAVGWRDRESGSPLELNSIYRIRSMTKPLIGTAILMLQDEGRLSLDDRVSDYLPSFDNGRARDIRIEELLTHTSGLGDHGTEDIGLPKPDEEYPSLEALVDAIGRIGPRHPRGEFRYSDSGSATLAAVVAAVAGVPVERFLKERIFGPLGMADTHTQFAPDSTWVGRMSSTYVWSSDDGGLVRYWDPSLSQVQSYFRGSGGVYSTPSDYARFLSMWLDKGVFEDQRLLSEGAVTSALQPVRGRHYGYHWTIPNAPPLGGIARSFGHGGSDGTLAVAIPESRTLVLFFTQSRNVPSRDWLRATLTRVSAFAPYLAEGQRSGTMYPEELPVPEPLAHPPGRFVGHFGGRAGDGGAAPVIEIWEREGRLHAAITPPGRPSSPPFELIHLGQNRFGLGRTVDGIVVEYLPDRTMLEFRSLDSEEGFGVIHLPGPQLFSRIPEPQRSEG